MDLYIERENGMITLEEWKAYVSTDKELSLSETGQGINPITKTPLRFKMPGRVIWKDDIEITYKQGKIGCEGDGDGLVEKLMEIARALSASVYDCGEKIEAF